MGPVNLEIVKKEKKDAIPTTNTTFKHALNMELGITVTKVDNAIHAYPVVNAQVEVVLIEPIYQPMNWDNANVLWKGKFMFHH